MIYATAPARASGEQGLTIRLFLLALKDTGVPIRLVWRDKVTVQEGDLEPELDVIRNMSSAPPVGPPVEPCHAVIRLGEVMDILSDVQAERASYEIALTDWPTDRVPPRIARRLQRLDEVWCWSAAGTMAMQAAGVDAVQVYIPLDLELLQKASPLTKSKKNEHLYYAIGSWGGWDMLQSSAEAFCRAFGPKDSVRLLLACDDAPVDLKDELARLAERPAKALPRISLVRHAGGSLATLRRLHAAGETYLTARRRCGRGVNAHMAVSSGAVLVGQSTLEPIPDEEAAGLYRSPQMWLHTNPMEMARRMKSGWELTHPISDGWDLSVEILQERLKQIPDPGDLEEPAPLKGSSRPPEPPLCVIIPHRDSPAEWVEDVVARVRPQLRPFDELIISTQTVDEVLLLALEALAGKYSVSLLVDETPPPTWTIARARNGGLWASRSGDYILTLDCDIAVPEDYLALVRGWVVDNPDKGLAPAVLQLERYTGKEERLPSAGKPKRNGTGLSVLPKDKVLELGGWDEKYVGYGSEDIDLLWRLRKSFDFNVEPVEGIRVFHQPHELTEDREVQGKRNMLRLDGKIIAEFEGLLKVDSDRDGFEERVQARWM